MALQIIKFEVVPAVTQKDPGWLTRLFGNFPRAIDLALDRFPDHKEWPETDSSKQFGIAWFEGENFPNWAAVDKRLSDEGYGPDRRTFPFHLATEVVPRCDELWKCHQDDKGPRWIFASSPKALWRIGGGFLYLPCVHVHPDDRGVNTHWVEDSFDDFHGFLVLCK